MDGRREVGGTAVAGRRGFDRLQRTARAAFALRNGCRVASRSQFRRDAPSRIVRGGGGRDSENSPRLAGVSERDEDENLFSCPGWRGRVS